MLKCGPQVAVYRMQSTNGISEMNSAHVVLVNPNRMKPAIAPLALDYLGEALEDAGFVVDVLDLCFADDPAIEIGRYFDRGQPLLVGVTLRNTDDVYYVSQDFCLEKHREIIECLRQNSRAPIVLGGSGFSIFPEAILEYYGLDLGVWGEGEVALVGIAREVAAGGVLSKVPGLVWRDSGGQLRRNPPALADLAASHGLRRTTVDNRRYFEEGGQIGIEAKRGCPCRCAYCADFLGKGELSLRSPKGVVHEIETLLERGIDCLHFCDSEFNLPVDNAVDVCSEIVTSGLGGRVRWYAYASPWPFSDELADLFLKAGCAGVNFGADSGSDRMLRNLGREFGVEDVVRTAEICRRNGLTFMYDLLLGGPGETRETLKQTIDLMKDISPDRVGVSLGVRLFPGTKLATQVLREGPLAANPNVRGSVMGNESLLAPVFYVSWELGLDGEDYVAGLIGGDERFFFASSQAGHENYNYNGNDVLVEAIRDGYRGALWDILRRLKSRPV